MKKVTNIFLGTDKKVFLRKLGTHIRKLRRSKGYSQDRLYLEAGFSRATMSRIERGLVDPQVFTLARIAETIGIPLRKLFLLLILFLPSILTCAYAREVKIPAQYFKINCGMSSIKAMRILGEPDKIVYCPNRDFYFTKHGRLWAYFYYSGFRGFIDHGEFDGYCARPSSYVDFCDENWIE